MMHKHFKRLLEKIHKLPQTQETKPVTKLQ
ncbi:hypothetical protein BDL97_16G037500 [Sphagnum fallax]|nr:hypothetical protein BDL97_16G037500 [Sphagnum fallax]